VLARTGSGADLEAAAALAGRCAAELPGVRAIVVDALPFHEAGGTDAQELGCALAAGTEYLRAMHAAGLSAVAAAGQLEFRYAATADQFATIAKLRAARRTWTRVLQQCGVPADAGGQRQHAVTSWPMLTRRDPYNNMLRGTLACFAAGVGGADAVTVTPFDAAIGLPDRLALRVARNLHALLAEESSVARVIDPAGGSWYVEDLSEQLAGRAWSFFRDIERAGGLRAALDSGLIATKLAASCQAHRDALSRGAETITGVSAFPQTGEILLDRPPRRPPSQPGGLPRIRWAQWHEELRDRADAHARATGSPPTATLMSLDTSRAAATQAEKVTARLALFGVATIAAGPGPVVVVCGGADAGPDEVRAAVEQARTAGTFLAVTADQVLASDLDVLAFGGQVLAALGVA
jgi:methylmalonyl-CoA mutase